MKNISFLFILFLYGCSSEPTYKEVKEPFSDSIVQSNQNQVDSSLIQAKKYNIDTLETNPNCSPEFLKEFEATKKSWVGELFIKNNKIYNGKEVIAEFPDYPKKGQTVTFTGIKDKLAVALTIKRINYTSISYRMELVEFGKESYYEDGEASISGGFFLGAESFEIDDSGSLIFADEYRTSDEKCNFRVLIGDKDELKVRFIQLSTDCMGKINKKYKDNFPLLREK